MDVVDLAIAVSMVVGTFGLVTIGGLAVHAALKRWGRARSVAGADEVERLSGALRELSDQVAELHERVDFAERLLAKGRSGHVAEES